ncbi:MAG: PqqD family protein [Caldilineae bacterium]|nr:PqqD family protein [Anaerolineae bacterium]MCB9152947.1 PqqD family protein [Caldilineae bacterium]
MTNEKSLCYNLACHQTLRSIQHYMSHLVPDSVATKDPSQIISRTVDDEALIIHLTSGSYYSLNAVGTRVWESIDGTRTVEDIAKIIQTEFDADFDRIETEVISLVTDLAQEGLVQIK